MAENSNVIYIPYGLDEIDLAALNEALANEYLNYLNSRVWTRGKKGQKRAQKWIDFHNKVSHQGITGASIVDGLWGINYNGQDFTYADPDEKQIAEDYASFVIDQMKKLPTRKSKEDKKEDKKDKYDFRSNFKQDFLNRYYGNNPDLYKAEWFELDPRGEKGIRGTEKRRERLIEALTKYRDESLKDNYDYEGTPFTGYDDIKSRITEAINALQSPDANDDLPALNKLGLDYRSMMYNGANDVYGKDTNGNPVTYLQYYDNLDKITKAENEAKAKAAKTARANYWDGFKSYNFSKFHGRPLKSEESNIEHLSNLFAKDKWSGDEASLIVQAFKLAELNGKLVSLSKEELSKLDPSIWKNRAKYLRKIDGVDGLYYDTYSRLYKKFYKNGQTPQTSFLDILDLNNPELLEKKRLELQNSKKLKDEDWDIIGADTVSMLGDLVSLGGGYAGAAGGITTILSDLYADIKRGKDFWDVTKNLAKNTAWGFAGFIPGVKLAKLGKRAAQLYALYNSLGIITDPDVHKSWKKLINGEDFTSHDFENLKWTLHAVTGVHNTARSHFSDNALLNKLGNKNKVIVETKNGKRTITTELQKEINKAGGRGGLEAANKKFQEYTKNEAKEGSFEFNTTGRKWYNPTRYSQKLRNATSNEVKLNGTPMGASKMTIGRMLVLDRNKPIIANPFSSDTYKNWFTSGGPNRGYTTMALGKTYLNTKQNNDISESSTSKLETKLNKTTEWSLEKIDKYLKNLELMESSFLNRDKYNPNSKTLKKIDLSKDIAPEKYSLADGKELEISLNNGTLNIKGPDGIKISLRISDLLHMKKVVSDVIKNYNNSIGRSSASVKRFSKEYIESLKELRRKGYLFKQGGTINNPHIDTIIEDFFKNNNI